ncbi:MAG: glycosyltransferase [Treponema sp.]|nr:glycosyltransferase [Treponema sp.]
MTIALFSDSYLPTKSGIVTVVVQLREQLIKLGHRVILVTVNTTEDYTTDDPDIYRVHSVPLGMGTDQFMALPAMHPLVHYLKAQGVEIIHCHTEFGVGKAGLRAARILKIPAICTTHTMWVDFYKYYLPHMQKLMRPAMVVSFMNHFYKKFHALIGVSVKARNYYKQPDMIPQVPSVIIPNSIDSSKFLAEHATEEEKLALRKQLGIAKDDIMLLFVGRIGEEKRVIELLSVFQHVTKKNPKIKAVLVGNGPAYEELVYAARDEILEKKIFFTGFVDWQKVHTYYETADIFVTTSLSEMHSMTILEAQMTGLPLVLRKDDSYLDSVYNGQNGYLCDSEREMEKRILELANDTRKREQFSRRSLEITKKFTIESHVKKTLKVYEEVIKAYPGRIDEKKVMKMLEKI